MKPISRFFQLLLVFCLCGLAMAQKEQPPYDVKTLDWGGGGVSTRLRITNQSGQARQPTVIRENLGRGSGNVEERFEIGILGPNESSTVYLTSRNGAAYYGNSFRIVDGTGHSSSIGSGSQENEVLYIAPTSAQLNPQTLESLNETSATHSRGYTPEKKQIIQTEPTDLPLQWKHYHGFEAVIIDRATYDALAAPFRSALDDYVLAGGVVMIMSSQTPGMSKLGPGQFYHFSQNFGEDNAIREEISKRLQNTLPQYGAAVTDTISTGFVPSIRVRNRVIFGIIAIYVIVAGPISVWYWSRKKRREMLFKYLPMYSVAFSLLAIVAFYAIHGFNRYSGSTSITLVNPETRRAAIRAGFSMLTAFHPRGGLKFDDETLTMFPDADNSTYNATHSNGLTVTAGGVMPNAISRYNSGTVDVLRERPTIDLAKKSATNTYSVPWHTMEVHLDRSIVAFPAAKSGEASIGKEIPVTLSTDRFTSIKSSMTEMQEDAWARISSEVSNALANTQLPAAVTIFTTRPNWIKAGAISDTQGDLHVVIESLSLTPPKVEPLQALPTPTPSSTPDPAEMHMSEMP